MAENEEISIIAHLLEVEKEASGIVQAATLDAEKEINKAKAQSETEFKSLYDKKAGELEKEFAEKTEQLKVSHEKELEEFKSSVQKMEKNIADFSNYLDNVFLSLSTESSKAM